jgi:hypothetical protein
MFIDLMRKLGGGINMGQLLRMSCGTKTHLYEAIEPLLDGKIEYVGNPSHGRKRSGRIEMPKTPCVSRYGIICHTLSTTKQVPVEMMKELGHYIGSQQKSRWQILTLHDDIHRVHKRSDAAFPPQALHAFSSHMSGGCTAGVFSGLQHVFAKINPHEVFGRSF